MSILRRHVDFYSAIAFITVFILQPTFGAINDFRRMGKWSRKGELHFLNDLNKVARNKSKSILTTWLECPDIS